MPNARSEVIFEGVEAVYHCVTRCVRRAFLCGDDPYDGRSYEHRRRWVRDRLEKLAGIFSIEVAAYAVMSNHLHIVLRTRPDWQEAWDAEETARRWLALFPSPMDKRSSDGGSSTAAVRLLSGNAKRIALLRGRLGSVSWFMRCLNENIARRANREDGCKGRFWEGRFYCQALLDDSAVMACMAYVDLNPVRAGLVRSPEQYKFTSIFERISDRDGGGTWLCPVGDEAEPDRRGVTPLSLDDYLALVDWTGRQVRSDKPGAIPVDMAPLLDRLQINSTQWVTTVRGFGGMFHRAAGRVDSILAAAKLAGKRWLAGITAGRRAFGVD